MDPSEKDRRAHPRFPYVLQITYPSDPSQVGDFTEDLSESGLFVRTDRTFPIGARIRLNVSFSPLLEPLRLEVEVVRVRPASGEQPAGVAVRIPPDLAADRDKLALLTRAAPTPTPAAPAVYRILIADDNVLVGQMFGDALRSLLPANGVAIEVDTVRSGLEAQKRLEQAPAMDLLITDRFMEPIDGMALVQWIRAHDSLKGLPIVMVSSSNPDASQQALALGANVYLSKPVNFVHIVRTVQTLLARRSAPGK